MSDPNDIICPVCGYYCLGKGGQGCIDKPVIVDAYDSARREIIHSTPYDGPDFFRRKSTKTEWIAAGMGFASGIVMTLIVGIIVAAVRAA